MKLVYLFVTSCVLAGIGGAVGSILGHAFGGIGLWIGGVVGGLLGAASAALVSRALGWIVPTQVRSTAIGSAAGFLIAAVVAVNTLSTPIGPVLSTALVGLGAVVGARISNADRDSFKNPA